MRYLYLLSIFLLFVIPTSAQKRYDFEYLTNEDGLTSSGISSIYQDANGILWIGSWDGLNSYNGRDIRVHKSIPNDPNTLSNNVIKGIIGGLTSNEIWVTTFRGVNRLNTESGKVNRYYLGFDSIIPPNYSTFLTAKIDNSIYCVLYNSSINYFDVKKDDFVFLGNLFEDKHVNNLFSDDLENLWFHCNWNELYRYIPKVSSTGTHSLGEYQRVLEYLSIKFMFQKDSNTFWIVDDKYNLFLYESKLNRLTLIVSLKGKVKGDIFSIVQKEDDIYVATALSGLWKYSYHKNQLDQFNDFDNQWVMSMYYSSNQDIMWFGTNGNGVIKMYPNNILFSSVLNSELLRYFRRSQIRSIYEHVNGDIWIGSRGDGLSVVSAIESGARRISHITALSKTSIMSIVRGRGDDVFIGTESGELFVYLNNKIEKINIADYLDVDKIEGFYSMYWDKKRSALWIGTNGLGLLRVNFDQKLSGYQIIDIKRHFNSISNRKGLSNNNCYAILPHKDTHLWIATRGGGLNFFDIDNETFLVINQKSKVPLSNDEVFSLAESNDKGVWIGTGYGLNKLTYDHKFNMFIKHYTLADGMLNHTIHGIVEDDKGMVWLSTNKGISRLDPLIGSVVNYSDGYGLQSNEFSDLAYLKGSNGMIFFGGINGINYFKPSQVIERKFTPKILITALEINSIPTSVDTKREVINNQPILRLKYNENFFNVSFVALDFINNSNCEYMYLLEGFNKEWVKLGRNNTAVFTNVPSGTYTLRVKSTNGDKVWVENELRQTIIIMAPWYLSWQAYLAYILLLIGIFYLTYYFVQKRLNLKKSLFFERLEKKNQQRIHDARLQFFTNIAHEFITPLTLIYGPVERLLKSQKLDDNGTKYLKVIKSNSERMQKLIRELMDFRKIDFKHQELSLVKVDLEELTLYIVDNFIEYAEEASINFNYAISLKSFEWGTDRNYLEKIIFNLISNAFKYTNRNGSIDLNYTEMLDGSLQIKIRNTGSGIKSSELESIFDNFHILENYEHDASKGIINRTGIGLALTKSLVNLLKGEIQVFSEENSFVEFQITLPYLELKDSKFKLDIQDVIIPEVEYSPPINKLTVLVTEDDDQIRDLIKDVLQSNYNIIEASNGLEALEQIKNVRPSLIISDIEMPLMNGLELLEEIKSNKITNHIPVIFLSVKSSLEDQISGIKMGVEQFITKPFNPHHLEVIVNQLLSSREYLREYYNSSLDNENGNSEKTINVENQEFINKITQIIESNLENIELNSSFLCNELFISRIQLYRKLKSILDLAPSDFIRKVKLNYSVKLLKTTNLTVQEIMFKSGFNNRAYFYAVFKKEFGITPLNFRDKEIKNY